MEPLSISSLEITESPIELSKKLSLIGKDHDELKFKLSYDNLSTLELKDLLLNKQDTKKLEPSEYLYISKLVKERTTKVETIFSNKTNNESNTNESVEFENSVFPSKLVTIDESSLSLSSSSSNSVVDPIGLSFIHNIEDNTLSISRANSDYAHLDWIGLYNYKAKYPQQFLHYWDVSKPDLTIWTGVTRDYNRTYYAKYWRIDRYGNFNAISTAKLDGSASCSVKGSLGELLTITWSNSDTSSSSSFCSLHNSPIKEPSNPNNYIPYQYQWAHKDNGSYTTSTINNGLTYYAVLWGVTNDGYTILATSAKLGPEKRNLEIVECNPDYKDNSSNLRWATNNIDCIGIRWSSYKYFDSYDYVVIKKGQGFEYQTYYWVSKNSGGFVSTEKSFSAINGDNDDGYYVSYCSWSHEDKKYVEVQTTQLSFYTKWMTNMWSTIKDRPLRRLVLPGSHDAGTYAITESSNLSPDYGGGSPAYNIIAAWSVTQSRSIRDQLFFGTRYFDVRVAPNPNDNNNLWVYHNFFSIPVSQVLDEIAEFSACYLVEIIILHFSHLYYLNDDQHVKFIADIKKSIGNKLSNRSLGNDVKCSQLQGNPIICIYDDRIEDKAAGKMVPNKTDHILNEPLFWYNSSLVSNYDETKYHDIKDVISFLENEISVDHSSSFWILQCILTIDTSLTNGIQLLYDSVYKWTVHEINKFIEFLDGLDTHDTNIIMTDFVSYYPITQYAIRRNLLPLPLRKHPIIDQSN